MPDVIICGDTIRYAELRHEVPLAVPDPFLYAETGGELQHALAGGGQSQAAFGAHLIGRAQRFGYAALVIVLAARVCKAVCS